MAKRTVMVLPVIFLSMAVLLTVFFVCLSAISENSKIHIGVVVPEKGFMERGLLEYVSNMADTKALCVFWELSETEAKEQLDEGKVAAYVTLPENLLEKIYRNEKTSVHITTAKTPTIESALMEELVDSAVSFVLTAKAGDYAAYQLYAKYGRQGSMKTVAMDMNRNYIRFVLRQETLFHEKTIKSASGMNDTTRIFLGIMVTLFVLLLANADRVMDVYRRRSAVIGFRCGVIFHILEQTEEETDACIRFAKSVADYVLAMQMEMFGLRLDKQQQDNEAIPVYKSRNTLLFAQLPEQFTLFDASRERGDGASRETIRKMISRWTKRGLCKKLKGGDTEIWQKLTISA